MVLNPMVFLFTLLNILIYFTTKQNLDYAALGIICVSFF
ncbi:unnamed protein product, partial [marine sediment metagenome]